MTAHWTVIASGPTGRRIGVSDMVGTVITANTAIGHVPVDRVDYALFGHSTNVVRGAHPNIFVECLDAGVKLISCRTPIVNTGDATPTPWHDQVEMMPHNEAVKPSKWCSGSYTKLRDPCGVVCVQYAIAHGATYLDLYGFEGWYLICPNCGETNRMAQEWRALMMYQCEVFQIVVDRCPDIKFRFHGDMQYELSGDNIESD